MSTIFPTSIVLEYLDAPKEHVALEKIREQTFQAVEKDKTVEKDRVSKDTISSEQAEEISSFIDKSIDDLFHDKLRLPSYYHGTGRYTDIIESNKIKAGGEAYGAWFCPFAVSDGEMRYGSVNFGVSNSIHSFQSKTEKVVSCYGRTAFGFPKDITPLSDHLCVVGSTETCTSKVQEALKKANIKVPVMSLEGLDFMSQRFWAHEKSFGSYLVRVPQEDCV